MELRRQLLRVSHLAFLVAAASLFVAGCGEKDTATVITPPPGGGQPAAGTGGAGGAKTQSFDDVAPAPPGVKTGTPTG